jgi:chaperonin GroES
MPKVKNNLEVKKEINKPSVKTVNIRPLMGYLLVEPTGAESRTASGIILPESAQEKPAQGKVIAVGEDIHLSNGQSLKSPVKVGEVVVYKKWGGDEIKINGQELKLVKFEDLMAIIED